MTNWVLLRGLGRDKRHWYKFTDQLREAYPNSKILPLDLPGIQSQSAAPTTVQDMVDEVRDYWLDEKIEGDWNLLAISLGGMLAIDWCYRYPNDFKHLVTINTSSKTTSSLFERISLNAVKAVASSIATNDTRERERKILEITTNNTAITEEMLDTWVEIANTMKLSRLNLIKQLFAASKFKLPRKLQVPYTVLASKADRFCDYTCSEKIARRFNAPLFLHESAGHDLPTDDAAWVIDKLQNI